MGKYYRQNLRTINEWRLPPEDRTYPKCDCCGHEVYDDALQIDGRFLCTDCGHSIYREWLVDGTTVTCEGCDEMIDSDDPYYNINGECYCEKCFSDYFRV